MLSHSDVTDWLDSLGHSTSSVPPLTDGDIAKLKYEMSARNVLPSKVDFAISHSATITVANLLDPTFDFNAERGDPNVVAGGSGSSSGGSGASADDIAAAIKAAPPVTVQGDIDVGFPPTLAADINTALKATPQPVSGVPTAAAIATAIKTGDPVTVTGEMTFPSGATFDVNIAPQTLANAAGVAPASVAENSQMSILTSIRNEHRPANVTAVTVTTNANGTGYVATSPTICSHLLVVNEHDVAIEWRYSGSAITQILPAKSYQIFATPENSSNVQMRRADLSTTPITIKCVAIFGSPVSATGAVAIPGNPALVDVSILSAENLAIAIGTNLRTAPPPANHGITSIGHGRRTNAAAGTALPLTAASTPAKWVAVQAHENNAGIIVIGGAGVTVANGGLALSPGGSATIPVPSSNLNTIFFDSILAGGVVRFTWFN